jgi:SEFIR domain-containing protein
MSVPTVFLSYRHESVGQLTLVRSLAERLEKVGLTVMFDQFAQERDFFGGGPDEGWPQWSKAQAGNPAHKILVVASPGWFLCYEGSHAQGVGLGAAAEAGVIAQRLYNRGGVSVDIRIVTFDERGHGAIPLDLQRYHRFRDPDDFNDLLDWLTSAPRRPSREWLQEEPPLSWSMANHERVRDAVAKLLSKEAPFRYLAIQGPSESGKSHITKQLLGNAMRWSGVACGRFDFKGTIDIEGQLLRFVHHLGVAVPPPAPTLTQRLSQVLQSLVSPPRPSVLVFDTFEAAGDADLWVRDHLLVTLIRAPLLRVVIAGQRVPERGGAPWDDEASPTLVLERLEPEDWLAYGQAYKPNVTLEFVRDAYRLCGGRASVLAQLLGPTS